MRQPRNPTCSTVVKLLSWGKTYSGSINTDKVRKLLNDKKAYLLQNVYMAESLGSISRYTYIEPCPILEFVTHMPEDTGYTNRFALYRSTKVPNLYVLLHADDCESIAVINGKMEVPLTL